MSDLCGAPSPGGNLGCIREPHEGNGHVWRHSSWHQAEEEEVDE